jgi:quercetin dioxygenase-like cupin family protein
MIQSKAISTFGFGMGLLLLLGKPPLVAAESAGHMSNAAAPHTCVVVAPGETRPEFGCFRIGMAKNLEFSSPTVFWHLQTFPTRAAANEAKSSSGIVVEEDGRVWLSEFGPRNLVPKGGRRVAVIGPLSLVAGKSYDAEIAYSVMAPTDRSRVHTHSGPEAWYVLAGAQCLETPAGTIRGHAGETMSAAPNVSMQLNVTGADVARALTLVIHDSTQEFGTASDWKPPGACQRPDQRSDSGSLSHGSK